MSKYDEFNCITLAVNTLLVPLMLAALGFERPGDVSLEREKNAGDYHQQFEHERCPGPPVHQSSALVQSRQFSLHRRQHGEPTARADDVVHLVWIGLQIAKFVHARHFEVVDVLVALRAHRLVAHVPDPRKDWAVNDPQELAKVLQRLEGIQSDFNRARSGGTKVSLAELIVLGGAAAIEQAAKLSGHDVQVPFTPGRTDASQQKTDVASFAVLEPTADGFRNYFGNGQGRSPAEMLVDRASMLTLTVPETTVLVGGMRALNANAGQTAHGVLTARPGTLSNDFFVNLLDMSTQWSKSSTTEGLYEGHDRGTGQLKWTATPVDLVFGSNSELRAVTEVYAASDGDEKFVRDFVTAWTKVMNLDRFDLH